MELAMRGSPMRSVMFLAALAVVCVGCSSDSTIPRSEYTQRVNELCGATTSEIDQTLTPVIEAYISGLSGGPPNDSEIMGLYSAVLPVARELDEVFGAMLADIRALPAPDVDADAFRAHWDQVEELWDQNVADVATASTDADAAQSLLAEPDPRLTPTNSEAVELGISECVFD
jgi:hypothetical protein